ncbi:hypothetical protein OO184_15400 [Photorhabdus sp. APURE]|uniref:hypothetical protein n=1 Tax=Photorhabdus aballayi TaxID=2991723 RepID=UPI00223CCD20|nr:hypothetical protein [Photorhabdus aballayi]MCW7549278.1 hypothetical protein [Photorhabdus aballayi]
MSLLVLFGTVSVNTLNSDDLLGVFKIQQESKHKGSTTQKEIRNSVTGSTKSLSGDCIESNTGLINSVQKAIRVSTLKTLVAAKKRGVDITDKVVNAEMNILVNTKTPLWVSGQYAIYYDKFIVVDRNTVETRSFSYSSVVNKSNTETVIVLYNIPQFADVIWKT